MSNKCYISKGKSLGFNFDSQMKIRFGKRTRGLKEFFFVFLFSSVIFSSQTFQPIVFTKP